MNRSAAVATSSAHAGCGAANQSANATIAATEDRGDVFMGKGLEQARLAVKDGPHAEGIPAEVKTRVDGLAREVAEKRRSVPAM